MTHPPQDQNPQPSEEPQVPEVPRAPRVPSPYEGTPASYGQPTPTSDPSRPIYRGSAPPPGAPSSSSGSVPTFGARATDDAAPAYGTPEYGANGFGAPAAPSVPSPYASGPATRAVSQQPMTWRTILAYVFSPIALLFIPISGVLAIVFAALGVKNNERTSRIALGVAIACTVLGLMLGVLAQSQVA